MPGPQYALAAHAFACLSGRYVIILDLKADRYFALEAARAASLAALVGDWPIGTERAVNPVSPAAQALAADLAQRGLLRASPAAIAGSNRVEVRAATTELTCVDHTTAPTDHACSQPPAFCSFLTLLGTLISASFRFRCCGIERIIERVRLRNAPWTGTLKADDLERARRLVTLFRRARPFLLSSRNNCLFESFVLSEFLAGHGLFPRWVFAVQTDPFMAHCWLQADGIVLDGSVAEIAHLTPIMAA